MTICMQKTKIKLKKFTANKKTLFDAKLYADFLKLLLLFQKMKTLNVKCSS